MKKIDDCRYECELGEFYKIFARRNDSWEFKPKGLLKEQDLEFVLKTIKELKSDKSNPIKYDIDPLDVHWTMDWRGHGKPADKPDTEEVYEEPGMLAVLIANGWIGMNKHWWEKDWPEKAREQFCIFLNMNDIFAWACADGEEITHDELKDVYLHFERNPAWGPVIWASKKRRQLPQEPVLERMMEEGVDVEGLKREIGMA